MFGHCLTSSDTCSEGVITTGNWLEMRWLSGKCPLFLKSLGLRPSSDSLAFLCMHSDNFNRVQHRHQYHALMSGKCSLPEVAGLQALQ